MRKLSILILVVVLALASLATAVSAGGNPPPRLSSGFQLQNRSTTAAAEVVIEFFNASGNSVKTLSDSIPANASKSYFVPNITGLPDAGQFSVVASSTEELFALVNQVTASGATPNVASTHSGFAGSDIGSPLYLPWVVAGYYDYNSMFAVQNAGSENTTITVEFFQSGTSAATRTYVFNSIKPGQSVFLDMTAAPYKTDLQNTTPNGFYGAVKMSTSGNAVPLAAALNDTNPTGSFLRSYNAVKSTSAATELIAPQVTANYYGFSSGITVLNPDPTNTANITVRFYRSGETTAVTTLTTTVAPGTARAIYLPSVSGMPNDFNGTAVIVSTNNVPVMGIANHDRVPAGAAASYNLIPKSEASQSVYMPQIVRAYYGFEAGYMLYNVGPDTVTVNVAFAKPDGTAVATIPHTLAAGAALTYYLGDNRGATLGTNFNGGAKATIVSGNGGLVGIANFVSPSGGDNMQVYNMFK